MPYGGEAALENSRATGSDIDCFAVVSLQQARRHKKKVPQTQWLSAGVHEIMYFISCEGKTRGAFCHCSCHFTLNTAEVHYQVSLDSVKLCCVPPAAEFQQRRCLPSSLCSILCRRACRRRAETLLGIVFLAQQK